MECSLRLSDRLSIARFRHEKVKDSECRQRNASQKQKAGIIFNEQIKDRTSAQIRIANASARMPTVSR